MDIGNLSKLLVEFYEKLSSWEESVVKDIGLTTTQVHIIEIVGHSEQLKMKDLADKLGVTTGTLTVAVDRLEKKGLLQRVPHAKDRRSYLIVLTEKGNEYFQQHDDLHLKMTEEVVADLSEKEQNDFVRTIKKMINKL